MSGPLSPPKVIGAPAGDLPAYVSNGIVGLRVRAMPLGSGMALLSGYAGEHPERGIEAAACVPYPVAADIAIDGVWLSDVPSAVSGLEQEYDFSNGELTSRFRFAAAGKFVDLEVVTFCSREEPTLACQEIAVRPGQACSLKIRSVIDGHGIDGQAVAHARSIPVEAEDAIEGYVLWQSKGALTTCGIAVVSAIEGAPDAGVEKPNFAGDRMITEYTLEAGARHALFLQQIACLVPSALHQLPDQQAARLAAKARSDGFAKIRAANRSAWRELWKGRILLIGADERWQRLADAAFIYLNCSAHQSSPASTSIFGLATWHDYHYYYGHVMWDIEAFAVPPLSILQPSAAKALLDYRTLHLAGARRNAKLRGRAGLQFPWESAPRSGEEAAPLPGTASWHEDHVSLDVALAFARHADITGDMAFLLEQAWPVLCGVARWIISRVTEDVDGYHVDDSMGIAERQTPVRDPAFTNMSAVVILRKAAALAERLGRTPDEAWVRVAAGLVIPRRDSFIVSHDSYRSNEEKGATPDPLMGLFPLGFPVDRQTEQATLGWYLERAGDYIGSPMLSALYGAWAARAGDRKLALKLLEEGYAQFSHGRFLQTLEYRKDRFPEQPVAGPFFANIGGFLTGLLFGFPRITPNSGEPESWVDGAAVLPAGWTAIEIERVWVHGRPMKLSAPQGHPARLIPL